MASQYKLEKDRYYGYCESATGIGMMGGPIIGQLFYSAFGFEGCFYSTAVILAMAALMTFKLVPNSVNYSPSLNGREHSARILDQ